MVEFFNEILAQMLQNRGLEGVWAPPWKVLGGFWAVLGSKRPLGCSVGSSRAALGQLKSHLGVQEGPKLRAKTAQKFCQDVPRCL